MNRALLLFVLAAATGCGRQVVLTTDDGSKRLTYDCTNFRPQVESAEQLHVLAAAYGQTMRHAAKHQRVVTFQALQKAFEAQDWRQVEQLVVEYRCANRSDF